MRKREGNKKQDLMNAGLKIFAVKGFTQTKISEIAKLANLATGTVYLYFENKEQFLLALFDELWDGLRERLEVLPKETPFGYLQAIMRELIEYMLEDRNRARLYIGEYAKLLREHPDGIESAQLCLKFGIEAIEEGVQSGVLDPLHMDIARVALFGAVRGALEHLLRQEQIGEHEISATVDILTRMFKPN